MKELIIITGGYGFIGSHVVARLQEKYDIIVSDNLKNGHKFKNLKDCQIFSYISPVRLIQEKSLFGAKAVIHLGACSRTTEWDGEYMIANNYCYSQDLLQKCIVQNIPFIYASSASVYGDEGSGPLNVYAYSKMLLDQWSQRLLSIKDRPQICGLRFFNVYGENEAHKGNQASPVYQFWKQAVENDEINVFDLPRGREVPALRDFIYVEDVCSVVEFMLDHPEISGIFDVGTGIMNNFEDVAHLISVGMDEEDPVPITGLPFPKHLIGHYQWRTQANLEALRTVGYDKQFHTLQEGVSLFLNNMKGKIP